MPKLQYDIPMEQLINRQIRLWERTFEKGKRARDESVNPCITISKEIGSQGVELAKRLAERLNWNLFDKSLVEYIAEDAKVRQSMVEIFDEKTQNEIHSWVLTLLDHHALGSDRYFKHLMTVIRTIGEHGCAVIVGRGSNFILPPTKALRLKVVAPEENRVAYIMQKQELDRKEADKLVKRADAERSAFIRRFYHQDAENPLCYDLVLNLGTLSLPIAEEMVIQALKARFPQFKINSLLEK
ncbi:cytidylate kinase-like family protein [candidate division KSB1 bacterium]|nr:cytidylate kinase-like family protein [candidate division KSB1 bacterium]NIR71217.1 cytidylate kinase-like family protein [candidate division KSB1 bacterium]NIS23321.1 cytidylate kinase-like family protein [candidate division KSB1 bacterium]NIT70200.1 cytidylate kinase-like family protein [candidate division KSB1 bacterium]NIU23852.1 cytidylate kinase-like family protein [candidate division KSB1 bacterium]